MRLFYNGRCIRPMLEGKGINIKTSNKMLIAKYKFNSSIDTLPTFNDGFNSTEIDLGTVYENETINIGVIDPDAKISVFIEGHEHILENGKVYDNYILYMPTTGLYFYHYTDGTESMLVSSDEPIFVWGLPLQIVTEKEIEYTDIDNGDGTITRTIYSDQLPTKIRFEDCEGLLELLYLNTSKLTTLRKIFNNCYNVTSINTTNWNTSKVTDMSYMFSGCNKLITLDVSNFDTSNVTDMQYMFFDCRKLTSLDVSNFNTSKVTDMSGTFQSCAKLTELDLSNWDTSNVTNMTSMFHNCYILTSIGDTNNWNVSNVTDMGHMFYECYELIELNARNWDTSNVINMRYIFHNCQSLTSLIMNNSNYNSINKIIEQLPTRTESSPGILNIAGVDNISQVDTATAQSKYWNIA